MLFSTILLACSSDEPDPIPVEDGSITGTVKDEDGGVYPGTKVTIAKGTEKTSGITNKDGAYSLKPTGDGDYDVTLLPPLSTKLITTLPVSVNVQPAKNSIANFVIQPQPVEAHVNVGIVDIFNQVKNEDGNTPTQPEEPLYAANTYEAPIGLLKEIKAPDGHTVTLSEFSKAKGTMLVKCDGDKATLTIALEGLIPNGTYSAWLAYLKAEKKVGEGINFNDFVNPIKPPVGSPTGSENVMTADANGVINLNKSHSSCILTDQPGLVIPIIYHINGKTFGGGEIPDAEQVVHLLVYFQ
jgi:hypothetical protein